MWSDLSGVAAALGIAFFAQTRRGVIAGLVLAAAILILWLMVYW